MKRIIIWVLYSLVLIGCSKPQDIVLTFNVSDPTASEVILICHSEMKTYPLDSAGSAVAVIDGIDAAYVQVWYGRSGRKIFIERGDRAVISFDASDMDGTFSFEGDKAEAVKYLDDVTLSALSDEAYALDFKDYQKKLNDKRDDALKILKAHDLGRSGSFKDMEEGRIRYAYATPLLMYPIGHILMSQNPDYVPDEDYYEAIRSFFVEDARYVDLDEYRNFIIEAARVLDEDNRNEKDLKQKTAAQMQFITDEFTDPKVVSSLVHYLAASYVDVYGIDGIEEIETIYRTYVKDEALIARFAEKYDKWDVSKPGRRSPDFEAVDLEGKEWSLADFKGRYVYIDLWATWCNPCKKELPYLKVLEEKFKDAEITFLSLSVDGDKEKWAEMVRTADMTGTQLYIGPRSKFQQAYNIDGIPRFILLDKEGIIISNDMSRPSSPDTAPYLEGLEGIR